LHSQTLDTINTHLPHAAKIKFDIRTVGAINKDASAAWKLLTMACGYEVGNNPKVLEFKSGTEFHSVMICFFSDGLFHVLKDCRGYLSYTMKIKPTRNFVSFTFTGIFDTPFEYPLVNKTKQELLQVSRDIVMTLPKIT